MTRMTDEEFSRKSNELLSKLPEEFRSAVSYRAYETGHAYGNEEILNHLIDLVDMLEEPILAFKSRIIAQYGAWD